jgi:hypothetical protein
MATVYFRGPGVIYTIGKIRTNISTISTINNGKEDGNGCSADKAVIPRPAVKCK